jgi:hypothetical protein
MLRLLSVSSVLLGFLTAVPLAARAEPPIYEVKKTEPKVEVGAKSSASLIITGKNGWHLNQEAPMTVALVAQPGVTVPKAKLTRGDLVESSQDAARFEIPFSTTEPGKTSINAEAKFVMCQEQACKPVKEKLSFNIDVSPVAAAKAAPAKIKKAKK